MPVSSAAAPATLSLPLPRVAEERRQGEQVGSPRHWRLAGAPSDSGAATEVCPSMVHDLPAPRTHVHRQVDLPPSFS